MSAVAFPLCLPAEEGNSEQSIRDAGERPKHLQIGDPMLSARPGKGVRAWATEGLAVVVVGGSTEVRVGGGDRELP